MDDDILDAVSHNDQAFEDDFSVECEENDDVYDRPRTADKDETQVRSNLVLLSK